MHTTHRLNRPFLIGLALFIIIGLFALPQQVPHVAQGRSLGPRVTRGLTLPVGFVDEPVITNLNPPRAFAFAPDGRIFITEAGSATSDDINQASIRVYANGQLLPDRAITLNVCGDGERGLLGLAVDPDFVHTGYIYVYYSRQASSDPVCAYDTYGTNLPGPRNRVSRLTMVGNTIDPASERVLIDTIYTDTGIHNSGDLHFGSDGYLYISAGDSYIVPSPAQTLSSLNGKILRIKPLSGDAGGYSTSGNPFDTSQGAQLCGAALASSSGPCREVYAYGLRNPFRFAVQPGGNTIFVGDVGGGYWEEVDQLSAGANYGWPLREGPCDAGILCTYPPQTSSGYADPIYAYSHFPPPAGTLVDSAITGGAFIPASTSYPSEYANNYLLVDGFQGFIRRLAYDASSGTWAPLTPDFATQAYTIIGMNVGPDGNVYYLTFDSNLPGHVHQLRRIRYDTASNAAPVANASVSPTSSTSLNTIFTFSAAGSYDPDNNTPLSYVWTFGDGASSVTTSLTVTHVYTSTGAKTVTLVVQDSGLPPRQSPPANLQVFPGDTALSATLLITNTTEPGRNNYYAGDTWAFGVTNIQGNLPLPANGLTWSVVFHHLSHTHPFLSGIAGSGGQFTIPQAGETSPIVWYRVTLEMTDAQGLTATYSSDIYPVTTTVALQSNPPGLALRLDDDLVTTSATLARVVGINSTIDVLSTTQQLQGSAWTFTNWLDGGTATHEITISPNLTLTANFGKVVTVTPTPPAGTDPNLLVNGGLETGDATGWQIPASMQVVPASAYGSGFGLFMNGSGQATQVFNTVPGQTYSVTAYVRLDAQMKAPSWGGVRVVAYDANWHDLGAATLNLVNSPIGEWQAIQYTFVATTSSTRLGFESFSDGAFQASGDNFGVYKVSTPTLAPTATPSPVPPSPVPPSPTTPGPSRTRLWLPFIRR